MSNLIEISVQVDTEAAEAVSELFNRYNGGDWDEDSAEGEASGGGAVIESTGFDDFHNPLPDEYTLRVKTYLKPGARGERIRRQIEEGLWRLSLLYPIPEPQIRTLREEDWAHAWKKFYKPLRVGKRVVLKPSWEAFEAQPDDIVVELDPGMAFGTGLHPSTRLCIVALENLVVPGDALLDIGTGSGVLSIVAAKLGATSILATDIDPIAVEVTAENAQLNGLAMGPGTDSAVEQSSVPAGDGGPISPYGRQHSGRGTGQTLRRRLRKLPLAEPLAPGGHLILAGIIDERADLVLDAVARHGLTLVDRLGEGDWVALVVKK